MIFKKKGKTAEKFPKQAEEKKTENNNSEKKTTTTQTKKSKWNSRCGDLLPH